MNLRRISFEATKSSGEVSARLTEPDRASALYVFAHGAGAGMEHRFMEGMAQALADHGIATFRFNFPYTEAGKKAPNHQPILKKTIRSAVGAAQEHAPGLPTFAGGKSMGGRMTSLAQSEDPIPGVEGLIFLGFPLHAPGKPGSDRGAHLAEVEIPMLFLQGTRDRLARLELLEPVLAPMRNARLEVFEGADHSFNVLKSIGTSESEMYAVLARTIAAWVDPKAS